MNTKHTPGPWCYRPRDSEIPPIVTRGYEGGFLVKGQTREREEADARLIAAAPDLLAALREVETYLEEFADAEYLPGVAGPVGNAAMTLLCEVRDAIAKAEGKS